MSIIKLKRSQTAAASPTGLSYGEVAVNITDKKIFIGNSAGATVLLVDGNATGGTTSTETIQDAAASLFTTGTHTGISLSYPDTNNAINLVNTGVLSIGGSTGVISAAAGRTSLGLVIGTDVQRYDPTLAAIAGLSPDTDDLIYFNGTDGASITTLTSFGRSLIDDVSATTARTTLGLTIGTNVQAWDADLDAIAALEGSTGVLKKTGSNAWSVDTDTYWKNTNDGTGSGLDADLIRGVAGQRFVENLQTGILYGGIISVNAGNPATVDITAGAGIVVTPGASLVAMPAPVVTNVTWAAQTAVALPQIANYDETWISFNSSGVVTLRNVAWTDANYSSEIPIGAVYHVNRSSVNLVKNYPHVAYGQADQMDPFIRAFGPLKLSGHEISANGANLSVNRTSGTAYAIGRNYQTDPNNPNVVTDSGATPASVVYRFYRNAGTGYTTVINSVIDPDFYDDGTGTLHATGNTRWQIQRIFYLPNQTNTIGVYYGTIQYTNLDDAQFGLLTETFAESESTATQGIFLGYLLLKGNCTDLSDTARAKFVQAGLFRNVSSGGGSGLLTTSIDDLSDVVITSAANDNLLRYSGGQWVNSTIGSLGISTLTGIETLTNKTLTSPTISNLYLSDGLILVEGTTNDSNEMSLVVSSLTADRTITFPNATGSVITTGNLTSITSTGTIASGTWQGTAIADSYISSATTWNTAYTDRNKWDGGATGLTAATGRTSLGLGSVENTAISTWAGSTNITTLGTIATGVWSGTAIDATKGGTGQTTYAVGDLLYSASTNTLTVLAKPAATAFLQMTSAGVPSWQTSISTSYLSSSSITVNGTSISLGSSGTVTATATNALTISTGLTGTSYNGSTAVTIAVDTSIIATKSYVDSLASGLHQHHNANAATTSKLATLTGVAVSYSSGTQAITWTAGTAATAAGFTDGTTLTANTTETSASHILVKNEGDVGGLGSAYNGTYYVYGARELRRASDGNVAGDWAGGDFIFVLAGTAYNNTGWVQTEKITTLDTDAILFEQFSGAGTYTADESSLTKSGSVFSIKSTYVGQTSITTLGTVGTGTWSATAIGATKGGTGQTTYAVGDLIYSSATDTLSKLTKPAATTSFLQMTSAGVPSWQTTIPATAGGTGSTAAFTSGALVYASSTSVLTTGTVFGITSSSTVNSVKITSGASPKASQIFTVTESLLGSAATLGLETDATPGVPATTSSAYLSLASSATISAIYMSASTGNDVTISAGGSGEAFSMVVSASELYGASVGVVKVVDDATSPYVLFGDDGTISGGDHCFIEMEPYSLTPILTIDSTTVKIITTTPVAGKVLTCMDGSGTASWETPSSARGWFL